MRLYRLLLPFLLAGMLAAIPCTSLADNTSANTQAVSEAQREQLHKEAESEAKAVQDAWEALLSTHKAQLERISQHGQKLRAALTELDPSTQAALALLEQEFQRLDALSRVNGGMPSDLTVLTERIKRVRERTESLAEPLNSALSELEQEKQALELLDNSLSGQQGDSAKALQKQVKQAKNRIAELMQYYQLTLRPVQELIKDIQSRLTELIDKMPAL